jgi:ATP-dependent Lon protease
LKAPTIKNITLVTTSESKFQQDDTQDKLEQLRQSLLEMDIVLEITFNPNLHDREIRLDNGWIIKIGRGLDFYQKPGSWYEVGSNDLSMRKCLETKVDIFKR